MRIHSTHSSQIYLRVASRPIVEDCSAVSFAPWQPLTYEGSEAHLQAAQLDSDTGLWSQVQDFKWLRATPSPNWCGSGVWVVRFYLQGLRSSGQPAVAMPADLELADVQHCKCLKAAHLTVLPWGKCERQAACDHAPCLRAPWFTGEICAGPPYQR